MAFQHTTDNPIKHKFTDFGQDRIEMAKWKIVFKESFNLGYFYTILHDYLVEEGWASREHHDFPEIYYLQRDNPNFGKELRIRWRLSRSAPGTKAGLFHYTLDLDWYLLGLKDAEVVYKGQKVKANKGEFELTCSGALIIDKGKEWEESSFKSLKTFLIKRALKKQFEMHKKNVHEGAYRVRDFVMNYFKMPVLLPEKEEFYARRQLE
ncbi:hypothetical protein HY489_04465 [Candidatus Woesearchaeota archaeon]|nr:hypothetical protein [Candidatus Woesearchaeota archaeon]